MVQRGVAKVYSWFSATKKNNLDEFMKDIDIIRGAWNDGFWEVGSAKLAWMHYAFDIQWVFAAVDAYRQYFHELESKSGPDLLHLLHYPLEFHFFKDASKQRGHLVGLIARVSKSSENSHLRLFADLERRWRDVPTAFPVPTGSFGLSEVDGVVTVNPNLTSAVMNLNDQIAFLRYKHSFDPHGTCLLLRIGLNRYVTV